MNRKVTLFLIYFLISTKIWATGGIERAISEKYEIPDSIGTYFNLGLEQYNEGNFNYAIKIWADCLPYYYADTSETYVIGLTNIGLAFAELNNYAVALTYFQKAYEYSILFDSPKQVKSKTDNLIYYYLLLGFEKDLIPIIQRSINYFTILNYTEEVEYFSAKLTKYSGEIEKMKQSFSKLENLASKSSLTADEYVEAAESASFAGGVYGYNKLIDAILKVLNLTNESHNLQATGILYATLYNAMLGIKLFEETNNYTSRTSGIEELVTYFILDLEYITADSAVATINAGNFDNVNPAGRVEIWGAVLPEIPLHNVFRLAYGGFIEVNEFTSKVGFKLITPNSDDKKVYINDLVYTPVFTGASSKLDPLKEMARIGASFANYGYDLWYNYKYLNDYETLPLKEIRDKYLAWELDSMKLILESFEDKESLQTPSTAGRYAGFSVYDALMKSNFLDLYDYFRYVSDYPASYLGVSFKMIEKFATWVGYDCSSSPWIIYDKVFSPAYAGNFEKIFKEEGFYIEDYDIVTTLLDSVDAITDRGEYDKSNFLSDALIYFSGQINNPALIMKSNFKKAFALKEVNNYEDCGKHYEIALQIAETLKDTLYLTYIYHNIGLNYSDWGKYQESIENYDKALHYKRILAEQDPSDYNFEALGSTLWGKAYTLVNLDRYKEAADLYNESLVWYDSSKSNASAASKMAVMSNIADTYERMNLNNTALEVYFKVLKIADETGDKKRTAKTLKSLAYVYFELADYYSAIEYYDTAAVLYFELNDSSSAAGCWSDIGQAYWNIGDYETAIGYHNMSLKIKEARNDLSGQGYSWSKIGGLYKESGETAKALESYEKSQAFYELAGDSSMLTKTYNDIAQTYYGARDYGKAFEYFEKSLIIYDKIGDKYALAETYFDLGLAYYDYRDYIASYDYFKKSLDLNILVNDLSDAVYCMVNLGLIKYVYYREFDTAYTIYLDAVELAKKLNNQSNIAYSYKMMGHLLGEMGRLSEGFSYLDSAYTVYLAMDNKAEIARTLISLGGALISKGEFNAGYEKYKEALAISKSANNRGVEANALNSIGDYYRLLGQFKEAEENLMKSLELYIEDNSAYGKASTYLSLGNLYNTKADNIPAMEYYAKSDSIYSYLGDNFNRSYPLNNIGTIYYWQGDHEQSLKHFFSSLQILQDLNYLGDFLSTVKSNIGEVYFDMKNYEESLKWMRDAANHALTIKSNNNLKVIYPVLAQINLEEGELDSAIYFINLAESVLDKSESRLNLIYFHNIKGKILYHKKDYAAAINELDKSISLAEETGYNKYLYNTLYFKALSLKEENKPLESISNLKRAVEVMNEIRGKLAGGEAAAKTFSSGEIKVKIFETIVELYIQQNKPDSALIYLDMSYNEGLKNQFANITPKFDDPEQKKAFEKEQELKTRKEQIESEINKEKSKPVDQQSRDKIAQLEATKQIAEQEYLGFIDETVEKFPNLATYFSNNVNPQDFKSMIDFIPEDIAIVAYLMGQDQLYIFVATYDSVGAFIVNAPRSDVERKLISFFKEIKDSYIPTSLGDMVPGKFTTVSGRDDEGYLDSFNESAGYFYNLLIKPVEEIISDKKKICFVPFGRLYYLPFEVLRNPETLETERFLGDKHDIFYVTSLDPFTKKYRGEGDPFRLIGFANSDNTLPASEDELTDIAAVLENSQIFFRNDATKDKVKSLGKNTFNTLHFATHGNLDFNHPKNTYLTMALNTETQEDGKLTIDEIYGLSLRNFKLVTLSACMTAMGDEIIEGWMVSPVNAFLKVGAQSVVASLWQVDDEATSILMTEFYKNLKLMSRVEALNKAKRTVSQMPKFAHPYYWAAFILVGNFQ